MNDTLHIVASSTPRERLDIDDPRALRAVAHEVRMRLIAELYGGRVLTATQAAERCGITPSAMSYHLRALAKWGIVERDDSSTDGRERPWRAAAAALNLQPAVDAAGPAAASLVVGAMLADLRRNLDELLSGGDHEPQPAAMQRSVLRLTPDQVRAFHEETEALLARYDDLSERNPPDEQRWNLFWFSLPERGGESGT